MIYPAYSIKDDLIGFGTPELNINDATACRSFREQMKGNAHPTDYSLFRIGTYNTDTGEFVSNIEFIERGVKNEDK